MSWYGTLYARHFDKIENIFVMLLSTAILYLIQPILCILHVASYFHKIVTKFVGYMRVTLLCVMNNIDITFAKKLLGEMYMMN